MNKYLKNMIIVCSIMLIGTSALSITNEEIREQAKILYIGNQIEKSQAHILTIPENERNANDYFIIGLTTKEPKTAIKAYEKAITLDKKYYQAYYNIGTLYLNLQNYEKSIHYFKESTTANKNFAHGYYNLGCTYLKTKDYNLARKSFESAIKINPEEPDYYFNLGFAYKKIGNQKRAEKAITLYNELIKKRNAS